jgi:hypothetical protein
MYFLDLNTGNRKSSFVKCLLDNKHSLSPIEDILNTLHVTKKGGHMNTQTKNNNQINNKNTISNNILFDTIICSDVWTDHLVPMQRASQQYSVAWCTINNTM